MGRNKRSNSTTLVINNESVSDAFKIAEGFDNYFSCVAENLAQDVEEIDPSYELFYSFYLRSTTLHEINI